MQISKSAVINLKQIDFVEPSFSGMMKLFLKTNKANISQENICLNLRNILVYERSFIYEKIFRKNFLGIAWGCTINCLVMLIISFSEGKIYFTANEYLKQLICSAVVGIAFALPTLYMKTKSSHKE